MTKRNLETELEEPRNIEIPLPGQEQFHNQWNNPGTPERTAKANPDSYRQHRPGFAPASEDLGLVAPAGPALLPDHRTDILRVQHEPLDPEGNITVEQISVLFEPDPEELEYVRSLKPKLRERVGRKTNRLRHGLHALAPLTCRGPRECPFISHCPIPSRQEKLTGEYGPAEDYPVALPCVMEQTYQQQKILDYIQHLQVNPKDPIEMSIVNELSIIDLHKNRALMILSAGDRDAEGQDFLRRDTQWVQAGDEAVEQTNIALHPAFDVLERLERRRERLHDRLLVTRKSKAEIDIKRGVAAEDSNLLKELQAVRKALGALSADTEEEPEELLLPD